MRYIIYIEVRYTSLPEEIRDTAAYRTCLYRFAFTDRRIFMNAHIRRVYVPMTESAFYILLSLQTERHGYGIGQRVQELTDGDLVIGPGTMYGTLSKMEKDGLIRFTRESDKKKFYIITELGKEVLQLEKERIRRLYKIIGEDEG